MDGTLAQTDPRALRDQVRERRAAADLAGALALLDAALAAQPSDGPTLLLRADTLRDAGRLDEAEAAYRALLADRADEVGALMGLGHTLRRAGRAADALPCFQAAVAARPDARWAHMAAADTLRELARDAEAAAGYRALLAFAPNEAPALVGLGHALRRTGDPAGARIAFEQAVALRPDAAARLALADLLRDLGEHEPAEAAYRAVLDDRPEEIGALMGLGHALRRRGDPATALPLFERAAALKPEPWARMAVGDTLRDLGRDDAAGAEYAGLLRARPKHLPALLALGQMAAKAGDRTAATEWLERAVAADPLAPAPRLALAEAWRDLGEFDRATDAARGVLARHPGHVPTLLNLAQTERRAGRRSPARDLFARAAGQPGAPLGTRVEWAIEERVLGRPEIALRILREVLAEDPDHVGALIGMGELRRMAHDLPGALGWLERAMATPAPTSWCFLGAAQCLADSGRFADAIATLDAGRDRLGARAEFAVKQAELLRRAGDHAAAAAVLDAAAALAPRHFGLWQERARLLPLTDDAAAVAAHLDAAPANTTHERARVLHLRGLVAADDWRFHDAIPLYEQARALHPDDAWGRITEAQARLLTCDLDGARLALREVSRINRAASRLQGRPSHISQTHLGQILDEFALDAATLAELRAAQALPPTERVSPLLELARQHPEHTPTAIMALIALRQDGRLSSRGPGVRARIPPQLNQFWDTPAPPADLAPIMASWATLYPAWSVRRFDDRAAQAFLAEAHPPAVLEAYRRARQPAQKADVFRLALLAVQGGWYVDADDRLVGDFASTLGDARAGLVVYQEDFGTIGNNLIGAVPRHPVILAALRGAVAATNRDDQDVLWLATGPGLLTRAVVGYLAERATQGHVADLAVLTHVELRRLVAIHCLAGYKGTEKHWSRTAFGRATVPRAG